MERRKRPPRRMVVFRCPEDVLREMEPIASCLRGGKSAYMVASLLAMVTKLGKEGAVERMPRVPRPGAEVRESFRHLMD